MERVEIYQDAYLLHDKISQSPKFIKLKKMEEQMQKDSELSSLFLRYKQIQESYVQTQNQQFIQQLYALKIEIDQNEKVKAYKKAYFSFVKELQEIKNIIFKDLMSKDDIL